MTPLVRHATLVAVTLATSVSLAHAAETAAADPAFTAHIDLASQYVLRGATTTYGNGVALGNAGADAPESSRPAMQWGADLAWANGWSAGYWASTINYSYRQLGRSYGDRSLTSFQSPRSIENDFYGAYTGKLDDWQYSAGLTYYAYLNGEHANAAETKLMVGYGPLALTAQTLLGDTVWGNRGDTYWSAAYTKSLPMNLGLTATLGAYTYRKEGQYLGTVDTLTGTPCASASAFVVNGCYVGREPVSSAFRHLTLALSGSVADTAISWNLQAIVGGANRFGVHQKSKLVATLTYGF